MSEILGLLLKTLGGVLAIAAVVAIGNTVTRTSNINNDVANLAMLFDNVRAMYQGVSYGTLTNTVATNANIVPSALNIGGSLRTPSGFTINLAPNTDVTKFDATLTGVEKEYCVKYATMIKPYSLTIGGTAVTLPADPGTVSGLCAATNTMVFTN